MCGIVGLATMDAARGRELPELIPGMLGDVKHRGPDGEGIELLPGVALGHRRLSIIDLGGGHQPLWSHDRRLVVTFNGEIFNYLELRAELEGNGARFLTRSDTEVLLEGYRAWGREFLARLNGQFALCIYDTRERRLLLARDRMGEKPLFHALGDQTIVFGSELKPVLRAWRLLGGSAPLNETALSHYLALNYVPRSESLIAGVVQLPPGEFLDWQEGVIHRGRFVPSPTCAVRPRSLEEARAALSAALDRSVELRLRSDVPVGLFLSGGIDSTLVAALVHKRARLKAFIAHFPERSFSEAAAARAVCERLGLPFELVEIAPREADLPGLIEQLVFHGDTPLADSSALPVYLLSQATARSVKVVLSGDGGDELFGGYLTYQATLLAAALPRGVRLALRGLLPLLRVLPAGDRKVTFFEKADRFLRGLALPPGAAHLAWNGMFTEKEKRRLLIPELSAACLDSFTALAAQGGVNLESPTLSQLMLLDQCGYLCDDILVKVDRMTMAHGLEARPVLLDPAVVELARSLPEELLVQGRTGRFVMRELLRELLPWYDLSRPKQGFSIPVHRWFRSSLKDYFSELIRSEETKNLGVFSIPALINLFDRHSRRQQNLGFELWGIMVLLLWMQRFGVRRS